MNFASTNINKNAESVPILRVNNCNLHIINVCSNPFS